MTDKPAVDEDKVEYIAMCYDGLGRADNGIDALLRMIQNCERDFSERGEEVMVIFHKGRGNTVQYAHGQALINSEEKISESTTHIDTELLKELDRLYMKVKGKAQVELDDKDLVTE